MSDYTFKSADGKTTIHCASWEPEGEIKAALLIVHGMCEFIERYDDFAKYLAKNGIYVAGHDHIGHGQSINSRNDWGYFGNNGNEILLKDIDTHVDLVKSKLEGVPLVIMGHSMGSFLTRQYICEKSEKLNAAIIMGTGGKPAIVLSFGKALTGLLSKVMGDHHRSNLIQLIAFGTYLKRIKNPKTTSDWLTKDENILKEYRELDACMFTFTVNGFNQMFKSIGLAQDPNLIKKIRKDLPLFFVAGDADPVGDYGKGVRDAVALYISAGIKEVKCKLYENYRHEIINEIGKEVPYEDIKDYILAV